MTFWKFALAGWAICLPAQQAIANDPIVLWGSLTAGMTKAEVKAAQPSNIVLLSEQCTATLSATYEGGKLKSVNLIARSGAANECMTIIVKSLLAKYGIDPIENVRYEQGDCGPYNKWGNLCRALGGEKTIKYKTLDWVKDDLHITCEMTDQGTWGIRYAAEPQTSKAVIDKL